MTEPKVPNRVSNEEILRQVMEIKEMSAECHRTLRGSNGNPGVVARIETLEKLITNDLAHVAAQISDLASRNKVVDDKAKDDSVVRWPYLLEKFFAPTMVAIIIFILTHYLFK